MSSSKKSRYLQISSFSPYQSIDYDQPITASDSLDYVGSSGTNGFKMSSSKKSRYLQESAGDLATLKPLVPLDPT
jgi:hypothetical protein